MSALTLTSSQQKSTLSSKKQLKKNVRNVFSSPCKTFWPVCPEAEEYEVSSLLYRLLPPVKQTIVQVGWNVLRNLSCQERQEKRQNLQKESNASNPELSVLRKELRKCLLLGVNAVTRAMEHEDICCVLIAGDVDPRIMVTHVVTLSLIHNISLLILPTLRTVTHQCLGFPCIVFGLKKNIAACNSHHFYPLYKTVSEVSSRYTRPENFNTFFSEETDCKDDDDVEEMDVVQEIPAVQETTTIYLHRKSKKERVFIPPMEEHNSQINVTTDFIPLSNGTGEKTYASSHTNMLPLGYGTCLQDNKKSTISNSTEVQSVCNVTVKKKSKDINYLPLNVKKIQPNPNKVKKRKAKKKNKS